MATLTVKNVPDELYEKLKARAETNRRSINSEVILCIERAVSPRPIDPQRFLEKVRRLRAQGGDSPLTLEQIAEARNSGRP